MLAQMRQGHRADALGRRHHHGVRLLTFHTSVSGGLAPYRDCTGTLHGPVGGSVTGTEKTRRGNVLVLLR
jgi:hypothetical protein